MRPIIIALAILISCLPALADTARVIDGDTLVLDGERIRLHGIDAPEMKQTCQRDGVTWLCGKEARKALAEWIGNRDVDCVGDKRDRYGRLLAHCSVDGEDIGEWMVSRGLAVAYTRYSYEYQRAEHQAKSAKLGMWAGEFQKPWDWRKGHRREDTNAKPPGDCSIKGNVSSKGDRIYHVPGGKYYDRTKVSSSKGERWFCSEQEAQTAGWRRSRR